MKRQFSGLWKTIALPIVPILSMEFLISAPALASNYSLVNNSDAQIMGGTSFEQDVLRIAAPNAAGVSVNRFSTFEVDTKPLNIINNTSGISTIVLVSPNMEINNTIEVKGPAADIVFLSEQASGKLSCSGCELKNIYRATFAVNNGAVSGLGSSNGMIGELSSASASNVRLQNFQAPGAINVDVLAGRITTSGTINLNERVNTSSTGALIKSDNGQRSIGSGMLSLYPGQHRWDYQTQSVLGSVLNYNYSSIGGQLRAKAINVLAASPIFFTASTDTRTDLISSVRYRDQARVSREGIRIDSLTPTTVYFNEGHLLSEGAIEVRSMGKLTVAPNYKITGTDTSFVTAKRFFHSGDVRSHAINFSAQNFVNQGRLSASGKITGWSEQYMLNQYGGEIVGDHIHLQTGSAANLEDRGQSYILNGSRTPYISFAPTQRLAVNAGYFDNMNHTKLGAYYSAGLENQPVPASAQRPSKTSAHIRGRKIEIKTGAFENINPYYEIIEEDEDSVLLNTALHRQVSVEAEDYLGIDSRDYIVNASAFLGAQKETGRVHFDTKVVSNERYRVVSVLARDSETNRSSRQYSYAGTITQTTYTDVVSTSTAIYSPPGVLFSMGHFDAKADNLFLNSVGYFEVFGDARFNTARLVDAGLAQQAVSRELLMTYVTGGILNHSSSTADGRPLDPHQLDSLFYVQGAALAANANGHFTDYSPYKTYLGEVTGRAFASVNTGISSDNKQLDMTNEQQGEFSVTATRVIDYYDHADQSWESITTVVADVTFSIYEGFVELWVETRDWVNSLWQEIKWWD